MGVIWGLEVVGFCWFLVGFGMFLVRKSLFREWCSCWYFVSILFDYLYLFCSLDWWHRFVPWVGNVSLVLLI